MYFVCYMYYMLYSYSQVSWQKKSAIEKILRENTFYSTVFIHKNPPVSGPTQFKPAWFKVQLSSEVTNPQLKQVMSICLPPLDEQAGRQTDVHTDILP